MVNKGLVVTMASKGYVLIASAAKAAKFSRSGMLGWVRNHKLKTKLVSKRARFVSWADIRKHMTAAGITGLETDAKKVARA